MICRALLLLALSLLLPIAGAGAQPVTSLAEVVAACGTPNRTYTSGTEAPITIGTDGRGCTGAGSVTVQATPAVTNAAYSSGNALGALASYSVARFAAGSGIIQGFTATSAGGSSPSLDIVFFNANPSGSTCTDKTAVAIASADLGKIVGYAQITSWVSLGTPNLGAAGQLAIPFKLASLQTIWACVITRTAFTPASTSDVTYTVSVIQD